ncbi:LysR family transcriptional regulator [Streptomyces sp. NPDC001793]|uniref:LysR family transcriptional regulator n=1 Tax=Streptomyces sp. NPDC001793 TaxID=3154657 RepID=UPI00332356D5
MPVTLDIAPLRSLVAVAACGGFHKAAGALHLTQAAVSRHVQRLEDGLGAELVVREGRSIRFTPAGERMLAHAHTILEAHDAAVDEFRTRTGTFTIGAMDHAADLLLPGLVDEVRAALPHRTVHVRLGRSARSCPTGCPPRTACRYRRASSSASGSRTTSVPVTPAPCAG